jgi:hypothetical protein
MLVGGPSELVLSGVAVLFYGGKYNNRSEATTQKLI